MVATCAMLLGISYDEALALFPVDPDANHGFCDLFLENILVELGYAIGRKYQFNIAVGDLRDPWPPKPWAAIHWCQVRSDTGHHAVVMIGDGSVLDPACEFPRRLSDYLEVNFVASVHKFGTGA